MLSPIVVTVLGIVILVSPVFTNALLLMLVTELGIDTLTNEDWLANALAPIATTG